MGAVASFINYGWSASPWGTVNANNGPAMGAVASFIGYGNRAYAEGSIGANIGPAIATWASWTPAPKTGRINGLINAATGGLITLPGFDDGGTFTGDGRVSGAGTTTSDSINARLSDKEYVVNAADALPNLAVLDAINYGHARISTTGGELALTAPGGKRLAGGRGDVTFYNTFHGYQASPEELAAKASREMLWNLRSL